jgi:serine/threonine-protein kinase
LGTAHRRWSTIGSEAAARLVDGRAFGRQDWPVTEARSDADFLSLQAALAGRYSLERELGRGGMGVVFLAREVRLDRLVAIKLLPSALATNASVRERFLQEARVAARLSHPNIVAIHAVDEVSGHVFYVMSFVDGETLAQRVGREGPMNAQRTTRLLREVAWALAYAHGHGIVHRDVKPANILIEHGSERAMVTDFGIAQAAFSPGAAPMGDLIGTPEYMSPEQARGESVDGRGDLYALGAVGYFALTGSPPFTAPTAHAVLLKQATAAAPSLMTNGASVPRPLALAIDRCLAKDPGARFDRGEALADALGEGTGRSPDIPAPVRIFVDRNRMWPIYIVGYFGFAFGTILVTSGVMFRGGFAGALFAPMAIIALMLAGPLALISLRMRRLLRIGYGPSDVLAALRRTYDQSREEFLFEFGARPTRRERVARWLAVVGTAGVVGSVLVAMAAALLPHAKLRADPAIGVGILSFYAAFGGWLLSMRWRRLREGRANTLRMRFWRGAPGRFITWLASIRLTHRTIAADRPTEMIVASSVAELYSGLGKVERKALADLPGVLHLLEQRALTMRSRIADLDGAAAAARGRGGAAGGARPDRDLGAERAAAEQRLAELVGSMESLRLDLLRLRSGTGDTHGITRDLQAARDIGSDVDRLIAAHGIVDRDLSRN